MTDDKLRAALDATLAELAESPLPGARYAYTVEPEPLDTGPCPHGYATRRPCPQCGVALAASEEPTDDR